MNSGFKGVASPINENFNNIYHYILTTMFSIGDYKYSTNNTDHQGWLWCDGRSLSITDYPKLYNAIGTTFGSTGSGFFNLPDFQGSVMGSTGQSNASDATTHSLGDFTGTETVTLTIPQLPSHTHGGDDLGSTGLTQSAGAHVHSITDPGHTHSYVNQPNAVELAVSLTTTDAADNVNVTQTSGSSTTDITIDSAGAHQHLIDSTGQDQPHNNIQPTLFGGNVFILGQYVQTFTSNFSGILPVNL